MPQYPIVSKSPNGKAIQFIIEDAPNSQDLYIQHHVNLDAGVDAVLGKMEVFERDEIGDAAFIAECQKYNNITPNPNTDVLVVFNYIYIDADPPRDYKWVKTFPEDGHYFVPGKMKVLAAAVGPATTSKTGGEAL
jgi:hypothetical protein